MNQADELIRHEDLAAEYQRIIGNRSVIHLNAAVDVEEEREQGYIIATRQPYKIPNIKAESITITLRFYVECEYREEYNDAIRTLTTLIGFRRGQLSSNDRNFRYFSFLDFAAPLDEPAVDEGVFRQSLEMRGTVLVTQIDGGAIVGNEVETIFCYNENGNNVYGDLMVLSEVTTLEKTTEAPQMSNKATAEAFNNTQFYTTTYTILLIRDKISERLYKALRGISPFGLNEAVGIISRSPEFTPFFATINKSTWNASSYGNKIGKTVFIYYDGAWYLKNGTLPTEWRTASPSPTAAGVTYTATPHSGLILTVTKTASGDVSVTTDNGIMTVADCTLTNGSFQSNAGAFMTAEITLQSRLDLSALADDDDETDNAPQNLEYQLSGITYSNVGGGTSVISL